MSLFLPWMLSWCYELTPKFRERMVSGHLFSSEVFEAAPPIFYSTIWHIKTKQLVSYPGPRGSYRKSRQLSGISFQTSSLLFLREKDFRSNLGECFIGLEWLVQVFACRPLSLCGCCVWPSVRMVAERPEWPQGPSFVSSVQCHWSGSHFSPERWHPRHLLTRI